MFGPNDHAGGPVNNGAYSNEDGTETVEAWECVDGCPVKLLDEQAGDAGGGYGVRGSGSMEGRTSFALPGQGQTVGFGDSGSASRFYPQFEGQEVPVAPFFYTGKATKAETTIDGQVENTHPTRKPLALMKWLVKLATPPNGVVLDPYCGSGTTCVAAAYFGYKFIGIERDPTYHETASKRVGIIHEERQQIDNTFDFWDNLPVED